MKIGVGVITYQRFEMFKKCMESVIKNRKDIDILCVVDDHSIKDRDEYDLYFETLELAGIKVFVSEENKGVGHSKNKVLEYCFNKNCDRVFTIEDDMILLKDNVFEKYIVAGTSNGIEYLNYALHGPANKDGPITSYNGISLYPNCVGSFSMHTKELYDLIGGYDEKYVNAWEHVDYYYQASKKKLVTPFWYFADIKNSDDYIIEQEGSIENSSIRPRTDWKHNIDVGRKYFKQKNGVDIFSIPK